MTIIETDNSSLCSASQLKMATGQITHARTHASLTIYITTAATTPIAMVQTRSQSKQAKLPQGKVTKVKSSPKRKKPSPKSTPATTPRKPERASPFTSSLPCTPGDHFQPSRVLQRYRIPSSPPSSPLKTPPGPVLNHLLFIAELNQTRKRDSVLLKEHDKRKLTSLLAWAAMNGLDEPNDTHSSATD